jgi:hypothetical protein
MSKIRTTAFAEDAKTKDFHCCTLRLFLFPQDLAGLAFARFVASDPHWVMNGHCGSQVPQFVLARSLQIHQ